MKGVAENRLHSAQFYYLAQIHNRHTVSHILGQGQIVSNDDECQIRLLTKIGEQGNDLRLHRDIECAHGLVSHDYLRSGCQRTGDGYPLLLSARELVGVALQRVCV